MMPHTIAQIFQDIQDDLQYKYCYDDIPITMYNKLRALGVTIHPYKSGDTYDVRIGKYEVHVNPYTFKVAEVLHETRQTELTMSNIAKIYNASAMREKWIFEINNVNTIHYYVSSYYTYSTAPYCVTEESYFQESTLHDFGNFTLQDLQVIEEFRLAVLECVQQSIGDT